MWRRTTTRTRGSRERDSSPYCQGRELPRFLVPSCSTRDSEAAPGCLEPLLELPGSGGWQRPAGTRERREKGQGGTRRDRTTAIYMYICIVCMYSPCVKDKGAFQHGGRWRGPRQAGQEHHYESRSVAAARRLCRDTDTSRPLSQPPSFAVPPRFHSPVANWASSGSSMKRTRKFTGSILAFISAELNIRVAFLAPGSRCGILSAPSPPLPSFCLVSPSSRFPRLFQTLSAVSVQISILSSIDHSVVD